MSQRYGARGTPHSLQWISPHIQGYFFPDDTFTYIGAIWRRMPSGLGLA